MSGHTVVVESVAGAAGRPGEVAVAVVAVGGTIAAVETDTEVVVVVEETVVLAAVFVVVEPVVGIVAVETDLVGLSGVRWRAGFYTYLTFFSLPQPQHYTPQLQ